MHQRKVVVEASLVNQQTSQTKSFDTHLFHENSQCNVNMQNVNILHYSFLHTQILFDKPKPKS